MSFLITFFDSNLFEIYNNSIKHTFKTKSYKQYIYKFDDMIGIFKPINDEYVCFKSDCLISNKIGQIEKIEKQYFNAPPTIIDDFYSEDVSEIFISKNISFKQIGTKEHNIIQIYFDSEIQSIFNFNDFKTLFETIVVKKEKDNIELNELFEILELHTKPTIKTVSKPIDKIKHEFHEEIHKHIHKEVHKKDSKKSKYVVKNTSKYEPKEKKDFSKKEESSFPKYKITMSE